MARQGGGNSAYSPEGVEVSGDADLCGFDVNGTWVAGQFQNGASAGRLLALFSHYRSSVTGSRAAASFGPSLPEGCGRLSARGPITPPLTIVDGGTSGFRCGRGGYASSLGHRLWAMGQGLLEGGSQRDVLGVTAERFAQFGYPLFPASEA